MIMFSGLIFVFSLLFVKGEFPSCLIARVPVDREYCTSESCPSGDSEFNRIIALGDIHGSYVGLLEDLYHANITSSADQCEWAAQNGPTLFVQIGDIVDRGSGALETWKCLRKLQIEASRYNSKVVRLLGNHELWWLEGYLHHRNKTADTKEKVIELVQFMIEDILDGSVVSAFVHRIRDVPILFTHAGINPDFHRYMKNKEKVADNVDAIANYVNQQLVSATTKCTQLPCSYEGEVFDSGPERGGKGIGGPFWTDFSTLEKGAQEHPNHDFIQVVGHTMAWCYHPSRLGIHPPKDQFECALGLIRPSQDLQSVCIDGGMYAGARAFLEINHGGHFIAHELIEEIHGQSLFSSGVKTLKWTLRDLSASLDCF